MVTIAFKLEEEKAAALRRAARRERLPVSEYIRRAVFPAPGRGCRITGRPGRVIIKHPPGAPVITDADLDAEEEAHFQQ
jgi:hypothetical protein